MRHALLLLLACASCGSALRPPPLHRRLAPRRSAAGGGGDDDDAYRIVGSTTVTLTQQFERGLVLQTAGDYEGALAEYGAFVDAADDRGLPSAEVLSNIGAIHLRRGDDDAAAAALERSLAQVDMGKTRCNLAIARLRAGDLAAARRHARAAVARNDDAASAALGERILRDVELRADSAREAGDGS